MNYLKKCSNLKLVIIIILVCSFVSGCSENQKKSSNTIETTFIEESQKQSDSNTETKSENSNIISFCAKEKSTEKRIYFNYPQLKENINNTDVVNELIVGFVESTLQDLCNGGFNGNIKESPESWTWNNNDYTLQAMAVDYQIVRNDSDYFSVTFEGLYNNKKAAHLINFFKSLVIDVNKCKLVTLSDLYNIDTDFVKLLQRKFKDQIRASLAERVGISIENISEKVEDELLTMFDNQSLLKALQQADKDNGYGFYSFLSCENMGISVPISHATGDHIEILFNYDELTQFLK